MRDRVKAAAVAAVVGLLVSGCGGEDAGEKPDFSESEKPALWNPCDAIDAAFVKREFGSVAEEENGTPTQPECRFVPKKSSGQPAVDANYLLFPGGIEAAWKTMGISKQAKVSEPRVPGADAARLVVNAGAKDLGVTGFVQNGELIQSVNVLDPAPYDRKRVIAGVRKVLAAFAKHAAESDVKRSD